MKQLEFDVAVIGGGPAGTVAAIASARRGAKTILVVIQKVVLLLKF